VGISLNPSRNELELRWNELERKIGEQNYKKNDCINQMLPLKNRINRINGEFKSTIFWIGAIFTLFIVPIVYAIIKACAESKMNQINAQFKDIDANINKLVAELRQIRPQGEAAEDREILLSPRKRHEEVLKRLSHNENGNLPAAPARRGVHFGPARERVFGGKEAPAQVGLANSLEFRPQG
jgi:outer membrane murein-binding lipoprotein Lpp